MSSFARRVLTSPSLSMHRALLGLFLSVLPVAGPVAQEAPSREVEVQIEKDVWIPLFAASAAFDADGFLAVQSRDLVRVSVDAKEVYGLDRYATEIREGFRRAKARGITRSSEARFLERTASGDLAYQTGYFRSRVRLPGGEERVRYSRFEFVLRKEDGRWRILVDKDTAGDGTITVADFRSAAPMWVSGR
ncbi:MAG TPA: DUF4440 domain-containing protein [Gemmatimonadales bacterium]|nr:DUF4440 domain-containing protein [Gemmatimonadales bacterium]